jgi:hypothetical protein
VVLIVLIAAFAWSRRQRRDQVGGGEQGPTTFRNPVFLPPVGAYEEPVPGEYDTPMFPPIGQAVAQYDTATMQQPALYSLGNMSGRSSRPGSVKYDNPGLQNTSGAVGRDAGYFDTSPLDEDA